MTAYKNNVNKFKRRKVSELQGLKMSVFENSYRANNCTVEMKNSARDTTKFNTWSKLIRRRYDELQGLLISIIESSNVVKNIRTTGIKLIRTIKTYINKIKLFFKYSNKNKH